MSVDYKQVLFEQKEELSLKKSETLIHRDKMSEINIDSNLAQIITGIRRSGKSTIATMMLNGKRYGFINFDDERLYTLEAKELNSLLESVYSVYGEIDYLLLDEIQNIDGWHLFVNRLLRKNMKIVLTGSNSNLLSKEMATHLTGRYLLNDLYTFSFKEYLKANRINSSYNTAKEKGILNKYFMDYLTNGGFPEIVFGEDKNSYIKSLFEAIVSKDIIYRFNIRNIKSFREIAYWLTSNYSKELSYNRIKNIFKVGSENTVKNFISYLEEAWVVISIPKFSFKKQESIRNRKIYLVDNAFASLNDESSPNTGRLLENVVLIQLMRLKNSRSYEVFYYKQNTEVDFLIYKNRKVKELIQVSAFIHEDKTKEREIRALLTASENTNAESLIIITMDEKDILLRKGKEIKIIPVVEWILEMDSNISY